MRRLGAGDVFGEMTLLLDGSPALLEPFARLVEARQEELVQIDRESPHERSKGSKPSWFVR